MKKSSHQATAVPAKISDADLLLVTGGGGRRRSIVRGSGGCVSARVAGNSASAPTSLPLPSSSSAAGVPVGPSPLGVSSVTPQGSGAKLELAT